MQVKLQGKTIQLGEWIFREAINGTGWASWSRDTVDRQEGYVMLLSLKGPDALVLKDMPRDGSWTLFCERDLYPLHNLYDDMYPDEQPRFERDQAQHAKDHIDQFLNRVNQLAAFL